MSQKLYCSVTDVANYLLLEIANDFVPQVEQWIQGISAHIEKVTGVDWLGDATASARLFSGNGCNMLNVDNFIGTPVVEFGDDYGENFVATTNFVTFPFIGNAKTDILMKDEVVPRGVMNVRITAKWGYGEEVPDDVRHACVVLVSAIVLANTSQDGEVESEKIGNYTVKYKSDSHKDDSTLAMATLQSRRRIRI
jgi:hypothetical protein